MSVTTIGGLEDQDMTLVPAPAFPIVLAGGERRSFDVVFKPTTAGARGGFLTVASNDPDRPSAIRTVRGAGYKFVPCVNAAFKS